jgi:tRNA A-37 threonylcarbamoyl transferase component Bud32
VTQPPANAPADDAQLASLHVEDACFKLALDQWLLLHADDAAGVSFVEFAGRPCVVKRHRAKWFSPLTAGLKGVRVVVLSGLCWLLMNERPSPQRLLKNTLQDEARRLVRLKAAGTAVPSVWYQAPDLLVLEYVGQDMPYLIRIATPEGRPMLMRTAAQELAHFHHAGFVHGGAQLRNLMMQENGTTTRIDFEENIGEALSLPLAQAYDVFQLVSSMAGLRGHQFSPTERQSLCHQLLVEYLKANPDPMVHAQLMAIEKKFALVKKYLGWLLKVIPGRDVQGFLYVTNTLRVSLHDE